MFPQFPKLSTLAPGLLNPQRNWSGQGCFGKLSEAGTGEAGLECLKKTPAGARCISPLFPFPGHVLCSRGLAGDPHVCIAQGTQLSWDRLFRSFPHPWMGWQPAVAVHPLGLGAGGCRLCKSCLQAPHVFRSLRNFLCSAHTGRALPGACPAALGHAVPPRLCIVPLPGHSLVAPHPWGYLGGTPRDKLHTRQQQVCRYNTAARCQGGDMG